MLQIDQTEIPQKNVFVDNGSKRTVYHNVSNTNMTHHSNNMQVVRFFRTICDIMIASRTKVPFLLHCRCG
jgi:hypothetical protein